MKKVINKKIIDFLKPQIIYIPLEDKLNYSYELLVKIGSYIYKNQRVAYDRTNDIYLYSSVSGYAVNIIPKYIKEGIMIKCLLIENDFKEKTINRIGKKSSINNCTKEQFVSLLKGYSIRGNKSNELTYLKYNKDNIKYLFINGVDGESGIIADSVLILNNPEELLEGIDAILDIMNIDTGIIVLKTSNEQVLKTLKKYLGTYPNIKIYGVPDNYPSGWDKSIIAYLLGENNKDNYIINNVSTIYSIYEMLKYGKPLTEKIISLNGDGLKRNICVKVKLYSSFEEIIYHTNQYKSDELTDYCLVAGSLERGKSIPTDELIVTSNLEGISVIKCSKERKFRCTNCGICTNICPVNIMPNQIMNNKDNKKELNKLDYKKCIECGLCSKSCPSKIPLMEIIKDIKEENK